MSPPPLFSGGIFLIMVIFFRRLFSMENEDKNGSENQLKLKPILIAVYLVIALGYCIYSSNYGDFAYRGIAYNFGRGLAWPFVILSAL
jgi:hypothetical protein